ncbi:uncharacterized protein TRIADDRAFT_51877 [Trichoplax adhaerens]|uniref:G-protein coupled receptors family 1 profile domain-containing protein n=1 Tax=Trichoplax adhaerens TaxID=10228 RepID=B3RL49_TRIAD|nr:hypothetical protein TRIADDRAFT_51877 [Trichoplax adhaerens]EDV28700.1 hypothetical protein TRIADDRAFT_51877 [Trichoplax adhaerens]|eukprot:XP_002107902.1 hypothetical protein TRIADDRAFT_51877 [Trichoplax adhaerens]
MGSMFFAGIVFASVYIFPRYVIPEISMQNNIYCSLAGIIAPTAIVIINLHLMMISWDKYHAAHDPFEHRAVKDKKAFGIISSLVIWILAIYTGLLPIILQFRVIDQRDCSQISYINIHYERVYYYLVVGIFFVLPFIIKTYFYLSIYQIIKKSTAKAIGDTNKIQDIRKHYKAAKVIAILVITYFLMWTPFVIYLAFWIGISSEKLFYNPQLFKSILDWRQASQCVAFTYPAINPILYGYFIPDIRNYFVSLFYKRERLNTSLSRTKLTNASFGASEMKDAQRNYDNANRSNEQIACVQNYDNSVTKLDLNPNIVDASFSDSSQLNVASF